MLNGFLPSLLPIVDIKFLVFVLFAEPASNKVILFIFLSSFIVLINFMVVSVPPANLSNQLKSWFPTSFLFSCLLFYVVLPLGSLFFGLFVINLFLLLTA